MSITESIAAMCARRVSRREKRIKTSQCFGQVPTLLPVAEALPLNKLENMSRTRLRSQSDCGRQHARPISLVGVASQNENLKISSFVERAIVASPAIPLTAKRSTVLAGVPRSLDGNVGSQ